MSIATTVREHSDFIWSVADLLRGDYKRSEYGRLILPLTVLRRLDSVLEPTKAEVLAERIGDFVSFVAQALAHPHERLARVDGLHFASALGALCG